MFQSIQIRRKRKHNKMLLCYALSVKSLTRNVDMIMSEC